MWYPQWVNPNPDFDLNPDFSNITKFTRFGFYFRFMSRFGFKDFIGFGFELLDLCPPLMVPFFVENTHWEQQI